MIKTKNNEEKKEKTCFVVMPIADMVGYDVGHFKRVYDNIIKPSCEKSGFKAIRADDVCHTSMIHVTILNNLLDADIVVCDLSGKNPNVMFELGIRQAFDKPVVLIQEEGTTPIFDISPIKYINYPKDLRYDNVIKVQKEISETITETYDKKDSPDNVNSIIRLLSITKAEDFKPSGNKEHDMMLIIMSELNTIKNRLNNQRHAIETMRPQESNCSKNIKSIFDKAAFIDGNLSISSSQKINLLKDLVYRSDQIYSNMKEKTPIVDEYMEKIRSIYSYYKMEEN